MLHIAGEDIDPILLGGEIESVTETPRKSANNIEMEDDREDGFVVVDDVVDYFKTVFNQKDGPLTKLSKSFDSNIKQSESNAKLKAVFGAIVSASERELPVASGAASSKTERTPKIIYLRDYAHIIESSTGEPAVTALLQTVQEMRSNGQEIVIVAGVSPSVSTISSRKSQRPGQPIEKNIASSAFSMDDLDDLLGNKIKFPYFQLVSIPPAIDSAENIEAWKTQMERDLAVRLEELNARNILNACVERKIISPAQAFVSTTAVTKVLNKITSAQLEYWPMSFVHRLVSTAIGISLSQQNPHAQSNALNMSYLIDAEKILKQGSELRSQALNKLKQDFEHTRKKLATVKEGSEMDMKALKEICNEYERKLISKIVDPGR